MLYDDLEGIEYNESIILELLRAIHEQNLKNERLSIIFNTNEKKIKNLMKNLQKESVNKIITKRYNKLNNSPINIITNLLSKNMQLYNECNNEDESWFCYIWNWIRRLFCRKIEPLSEQNTSLLANDEFV